MLCGDASGGIYYSDAYPAPLFIVKSKDEEVVEHYFIILMSHLPVPEDGGESMVNYFEFYAANGEKRTIVIPRRKLRPNY